MITGVSAEDVAAYDDVGAVEGVEDEFILIELNEQRVASGRHCDWESGGWAQKGEEAEDGG